MMEMRPQVVVMSACHNCDASGPGSQKYNLHATNNCDLHILLVARDCFPQKNMGLQPLLGLNHKASIEKCQVPALFLITPLLLQTFPVYPYLFSMGLCRDQTKIASAIVKFTKKAQGQNETINWI